MKTAIVTDSNSGITQALSKELGIFTIPMPVLINGGQFLEDISLTQEEFYEKLKDDTAQVSTSQPSAYDVSELWKKILEDYDDIVCIPMSSGLSETCHSLAHAAETEFAGKVYVVDNKRISVTQKSSVYDAIELAKQGKNAKDALKIAACAAAIAVTRKGAAPSIPSLQEVLTSDLIKKEICPFNA